MLTIGERVRMLRTLAGLSQQQLGIACGYTRVSAQRTICAIEQDRRLPQTEILRPMCRALHTTIDALIPENLTRNGYE